MTKMKKILKRTALVLVSLFALLFAYVHLVEHRSLASWAVEKFLWITKERNLSEEQLQEKMAKLQETNNQPIAVPDVSRQVTETYVDNMQVFTWNDKQDKNQKVILYIHGGGYINQASSSHFSAVDKMAQQLDAKVVFPVYPLAPQYTYKDVYPKMEALYKEVLAVTADSQNVTIMGDSAGGGFSLGFAMYARDHQLPQPKDIILLSPWSDVKTDNPAIADYEKVEPMLSVKLLQRAGEAWAGSKAEMTNPYVSPIFGDFTGLGKISIFVGIHEIFYPDNEKLHELLTEQGIDHNYTVGDKMNHVYAIYPIPEAKDAQANIIKIIQGD